LILITEGQHLISDQEKFTPDWRQQLMNWLNEKLTVK